MFIGIRFFVSITTICIFANLNSLQMLVDDSGSPNVDELIPIEKPRAKYYDGGNDQEAELFLLTKSLGFIVCDQQLPLVMENFEYAYTIIKYGHSVDRKHQANRFREASVEEKRGRCQRYLNEPVLRENKIFLTDDPFWLEKIQVEKRELYFDYYAREPEIVEAISCPVSVRNQIRMMYIASIGSEENAKGEQFFVMVERSPNESSKLSILMRAVVESDLEDGEDETIEDVPELLVENSNRCDIQLTVQQHWHLYESKLFGKDAERAYITTLYGFVNLKDEQLLVDRFVELVEDLKKVYKVESAITKDSIKGMPDNEKLQLCNRYVRESVLLSPLPIYPVTNEEDLEHKIEVTDVEINYQRLTTGSETHEFLMCPAVYATKGGERRRITLYVMPVAFQDESRCGRYSFLKLDVPTEGETWAQNLLLYSKQEAPKIFSDTHDEG